MPIPLLTIDAFAAEPFSGNPAAICLLDEPRETEWMQALAGEMNLSETAFVHPLEDAWRLRWFTPAVEVELCGHATLAAAHALWETGHLAADRPAVFETLSGRLTATRSGEWIELDFPAEPAVEVELPEPLAGVFGSRPVYVGKNRFDYIVELDSAEQVRSLQPDIDKIRQVGGRGVIVTGRGDDKFDFVSRFFAPACGIDEDPVCGSAHCCLGPHWGKRLDKQQLLGHQVSPRGGVVRVALNGDRVRLGGKAVTVLRGELLHG